MAKSLYVLAITASGLGLAGCGGVETSGLPLRMDFTDCGGFTMNDEIATIDCPDGELRIHVDQPEVSAIHLAPFRFDSATPVLAVEGDVRGVSGPSAYGLGCAVTEAGEPGRGYLFVIVRGDPGDGTASILRLDSGRDETTQSIRSVGNKRKAVLDDGPHRLRAQCRNAPDGSAQLSLSVDGKVLVAARDRQGMGRFTAALAAVLAAAPGSEARFDNVSADDAGARG